MLKNKHASKLSWNKNRTCRWPTNSRRLSATRLQEWYQQAEATGFAEWQEAVKTIRNWEHDILNYFHWRVTNAFTEGRSNTVKVVKRCGYGYRNFDNLRRRILLEGT